jgi:hypothetical protein
MAQAQQAGEPNRKQPTPYKKNRFAHTANTKYGMGDHYGTGIKQKLGRMRDDSMGMKALTPKKLKKPPKNLA